MANEFAGQDTHSAEYFGEQRNYWYNDDYLAFLRRAWGLDTARTVLDVGSGAGHWSRVIASMVAEDATLVGVDREAKWVQVATERAAFDRLWAVAGRVFARLVDDLRAGTYAQAGGFVMYLVCGTKGIAQKAPPDS